MTQATPTPYYIGNAFNDERPLAICSQDSEDTENPLETTIAEICGPDDIAQADAEFICQACNAYADLMAVCQRYVELYTIPATDYNNKYGHSSGPLLDAAQKALAKGRERYEHWNKT